MYSAFYFFGALADIFISLILWFVLDSEKPPIFIVDGNYVYSVEDVVFGRQSTINEDCDSEEVQENEQSNMITHASNRFSSISRRMVEQFFTEVEGPDRNWGVNDYD